MISERTFIYFAPMEGVTTAALRVVHHRIFPGTDRYYTPFLTATKSGSFKTRELRDIDPKRNAGIPLAVQLQALDPVDFARSAWRMEELGYEEVNLNLGCPAATAVSRGRGAGMLGDPEIPDRFFDTAFRELERLGCSARITVKTRIGLDTTEHAPALIRVFNRYPIRELIVHPRLRIEYYGGEPKLDVFRDWMRESVHPLCYNGDITTVKGFEALQKNLLSSEESSLSGYMIGRGLLRNPALIREIRGGAPLEKTELAAYMAAVLRSHIETGIGENNAVWRMKELWSDLRPVFPDADKGFKKLRKARDLPAYEAAAAMILETDMGSAEGISAAPVRI